MFFLTILGTIYIFFIPGLIIANLLFRKLGFLEKIVLSIALSVSVLILSTLILQFVKLQPNLINTLVTITSISIIVILIKAGRAHGRLVGKQNNETQN